MVKVSDLYTDFYPVQNKKLKELLIRNTQFKKTKKGEYLFHQGEKDKRLCFLESGIVVSNEIGVDGRNHYYNIVDSAGDIIVGGLGPADTYSPVNIIVQYGGGVFSISMERIFFLQQNYPEIMRLYNQILLAEYEKQWQIKKMLYLDSAAERYKWFLKRHPLAAEKVSDKVIARFLRMSPVTLSRLKNRN